MTGNATFSGTSYQSRLLAYIYVHILTQRRLRWLERSNDLPIAVSAETDGPGDDIRVEFVRGSAIESADIQAKHGFEAGQVLSDFVNKVKHHYSKRSDFAVVLVVDRGSTKSLYLQFKADLERLRSGRTDSMREPMRSLINSHDPDINFLQGIYSIAADLDREGEPEAKYVIESLGSILQDPSQNTAAWGVLVNDANTVCADKLRRTRSDLISLLEAAGIQISPPQEHIKWMNSIEFIKDLTTGCHYDAALWQVTRLEDEARKIGVSNDMRSLIHGRRASILYQMGQYSEALNIAENILELVPGDKHATEVKAWSLFGLGDTRNGIALIRDLIASPSPDPRYWATLVQMLHFSKNAVEEVPKEFLHTVIVQSALAKIAINDSNWSKAVNVTDFAMTLDAGQTPDVLSCRAYALYRKCLQENDCLTDEIARKILRATNQALQQQPYERHQSAPQNLQLRAMAHAALGNTREEEIDLDRLQELFPDDPNALYLRAQKKINQTDWIGALEILSAQIAMGVSRLLVLRAIALRGLERSDEALESLQSAIDNINEDEPEITRLIIIEAAINFGYLHIASSMISSVSETLPGFDYVRARLDLATGDLEKAKKSVDAAVANDGDKFKTALLSKLGRQYYEKGEIEEALKAWEQSVFIDMPEGDQQCYMNALLQSSNLEKADKIIKESFASEQVPSWVLSAAIIIAQRREDPSEVIEKLNQLIEIETNFDPSARLELSRHLLDLDMREDAEEHIKWLRQHIAVLSPRQTMYLAQLMDAAGLHSDSIDVALNAFRHGRTNSSIHKAFSTLCLLNKQNNCRLRPSVICANSYFCLRKKKGVSGGNQLYYYVFENGPIDATRKEISVESARRMGYWGKKIGDEIIINEGSWNEEIWCVEEIKDAAMQLAVDVISNYHVNFPEEDFFAASVHLDPKGNPDDMLETLKQSLLPKEKSSRNVLESYRKASPLPLPLGMVAMILNVSLSEAMIAICQSTKIAGPLRVEWSDTEGREESKAAAQQSQQVVLTRSALVTAQVIDALDILKDKYSLIAPHSLRQELKKENIDLQRNFEQGIELIGVDEGKIYRTQYDAGHEFLRLKVDHFQNLWTWVEQHVSFLALPLSKVFPSGSQEDVCRNSIGRSSMDAVSLSQAENIAMYADDLGLRHFFKKGDSGRSFSSIGLVRGWAELGVITPSDRDEMFLKMLMMNYDGVPINLSLIQIAFNHYPNINQKFIENLLRILFDSLKNVQDAARISSALLKKYRLTNDQSSNLGLLTSIMLEAMINRWGMPISSTALKLHAEIAFLLLPDDLNMIEAAIKSILYGTIIVK